jgi:hypothetical protein
MSEARQNAARPHYRGSWGSAGLFSFTNALEDTQAAWNYLDYVGALKTRPVLIVESHDGNVSDNKALAEALRKAGDPQVTEVYM